MIQSGSARDAGRRSASGHRIGEWHQNAKLLDADVLRMRFLYAAAKAQGRRLGYGRLAQIFRCGESTVRDICTFRTRCDV